MKVSLIGLMLISALFSFSKLSAQSSYKKILPLFAKYQEQDEWCWVASTQILANYYSNNYLDATQCQIINFANRFGFVDSRIPSNCCTRRNYKRCNVSNGGHGIAATLAKMSVPVVNILPYAVNIKTVKALINRNAPINALIRWKSGGGHSYIIAGYQNNNIYYLDPGAEGEGYNLTSLEYLRTGIGGNGLWSETIIMRGKRVPTAK